MTHTPGAMRAAQAIADQTVAQVNLGPFLKNPATLRELAELIDDQTAASDMLAALKKCVWVFEQLADAGNYPAPLFQNGGWMFAADAIAKADPATPANNEGSSES